MNKTTEVMSNKIRESNNDRYLPGDIGPGVKIKEYWRGDTKITEITRSYYMPIWLVMLMVIMALSAAAYFVLGGLPYKAEDSKASKKEMRQQAPPEELKKPWEKKWD
ncbi:MAG: hypothetical protein GC192_17630 [Bacteroidetes bacterium]|nr:hypothetical protein [Bacteroidota bacterium]